MGYTKGPWKIKLEKNKLAMNGVGIYSVSGPKGIICNTEESTIEETEANARLIAAAPEILEVLELCLPIVRREKHSFETDSVQHPTVELILKVIKKAKGE